MGKWLKAQSITAMVVSTLRWGGEQEEESPSTPPYISLWCLSKCDLSMFVKDALFVENLRFATALSIPVMCRLCDGRIHHTGGEKMSRWNVDCRGEMSRWDVEVRCSRQCQIPSPFRHPRLFITLDFSSSSTVSHALHSTKHWHQIRGYDKQWLWRIVASSSMLHSIAQMKIHTSHAKVCTSWYSTKCGADPSRLT